MPSRRRINRQQLGHEIQLKMETESRRPRSEVKLKTKAEAEKVATYWRDVAWPLSTGNHGPGVHPYDTGEYRESIGVEQGRDVLGRFLAEFIVITRHKDATFIEFGTGVDKPGSRSPWGPNTPTPEFAPAARTAHFFKGTAP